MESVGMPAGLADVGYTDADVTSLAAGAFPQQRLLGNAPIDVDEALLATIFRGALSYA